MAQVVDYRLFYVQVNWRSSEPEPAGKRIVGESV